MNITTILHLAFDLATLFAVVISYIILRDQARILTIKVHEAKTLIDRLNHGHFSAEDRPKNRDGAEHDGGYRAPARTLLGDAVRDDRRIVAGIRPRRITNDGLVIVRGRR